MRAGNTMIVFGLLWSTLTLLFDGFIVVPTVRQFYALRLGGARIPNPETSVRCPGRAVRFAEPLCSAHDGVALRPVGIRV